MGISFRKISFILFLLFLNQFAAAKETKRRPAQASDSSASVAMKTFHWAWNPMFGCLEQDKTPDEIVRGKKVCKAQKAPNKSATLIFVQCAIEVEGKKVGSLDYVFVESEYICRQVEETANNAKKRY